MASMGSTRPSESFAQVTDKMRLADVPSEILNVPTMNGCFAQKRAVTKNAAMSESRTNLPLAAPRHFGPSRRLCFSRVTTIMT